MDKVFGRAEDKYLRNVYFYAYKGDSDTDYMLYLDAEHKVGADEKVVGNAFDKNMITIVLGDEKLIPFACAKTGATGGLTLTCAHVTKVSTVDTLTFVQVLTVEEA